MIDNFLKISHILSAVIMMACAAHADIAPQVINQKTISSEPYKYVGLVSSKRSDGQLSTCTGTVVNNNKTMVSAAHCIYNPQTISSNPWAEQSCWAQQWNSSSYADCTSTNYIRGMNYFTSYASFAQSYSNSSIAAYNSDFVVFFDYRDFADSFSQLASDSRTALHSHADKMIVGYPAGNYPDFHVDKYMMHQTGVFQAPFTEIYQNYYYMENISVGRGNSGGPVFIFDRENNSYKYAATYVANSRVADGYSINAIGVRAIDSTAVALLNDSTKMISQLTPVQQTIANAENLIEVSSNDFIIPNQQKVPIRANRTDMGVVLGNKPITFSYTIKNISPSQLSLDRHSVRLISRSKQFKIVKYPARKISSQNISHFRISFIPRKIGPDSASIKIQISKSLFSFKISAINRQ